MLSGLVIASLCKDASQMASFVTDALKLDFLLESQFVFVS